MLRNFLYLIIMASLAGPPRSSLSVSHLRDVFSHASIAAVGIAMSVCRLIHHFGPEWNISTAIWYIAVTLEDK